MRKISTLVILILLGIIAYLFFSERNTTNQEFAEGSSLIQKEIRSVGKLIVTEGSFAQVFSYKDSKRLYFDLLTARKKALVVVNSEVSISYDLRAMEIKIDEQAKTITILRIPKPEININPDIEYYDVTQDYLNPFDAQDYNKIKDRVTASIRKKVEASELPARAQQRLISELSRIYAVTQALGWELKYNTTAINSSSTLEGVIKS